LLGKCKLTEKISVLSGKH